MSRGQPQLQWPGCMQGLLSLLYSADPCMHSDEAYRDAKDFVLILSHHLTHVLSGTVAQQGGWGSPAGRVVPGTASQEHDTPRDSSPLAKRHAFGNELLHD